MISHEEFRFQRHLELWKYQNRNKVIRQLEEKLIRKRHDGSGGMGAFGP